jgi:signal transduction histidine kinase
LAVSNFLVAFSLPVGATVFGALTEVNAGLSYSLKKNLIVHCVLVENVLTMLILTREVLRREKRRLVLERDFQGKVVEQSDKFRQAVAHDLHDDLSQRILAVRMALFQETRESGGLTASVEAQFQDLADAVREVSHQMWTSSGNTCPRSTWSCSGSCRRP